MRPLPLVFFVLLILQTITVNGQNQFPCDGKIYYFTQDSLSQAWLGYVDQYTFATPVNGYTCPLPGITKHNALGANPADGYLYFQADSPGASSNVLYRLKSDCSLTFQCPGIFRAQEGCFDQLGRYWFFTKGDSLVAFDVNTCSVVKGPFPVSPKIGVDLSFNMADCHFYIADADSVVEIDTNGVIVSIYNQGFGGGGSFGGFATGVDGNLYGMPNGGSPGELYMFNLKTHTAGGLVYSFNPGPQCGCDMASFSCASLTSDFKASALTSCDTPFTVAFTNTSTGLVDSLIWDFDDGTLNDTSYNAVHTFIKPGTYHVKLIVKAFTECFIIPADTHTVTVMVYARPVVSAGTDTTICSGTTTVLSANGSLKYSWFPSTGLSCDTCPNPIANPTATTVYTLVGSDINGCTDTDAVVVTVQPNILVDAGSFQNLCSGSSVMLSANAPGAVSYTWTPIAGLSCTNCQSPVANPIVTTIYTVGATNGFCSGIDTVTVFVHSSPKVNAGNDLYLCSVSFDTLRASGASLYSWSPSTFLSCDTCAITQVKPLSDMQYIVIGTDAYGCKGTDTVMVKIGSIPVAVTGKDTLVSYGNSVQLFAAGGNRYKWNPSTGLDCDSCQFPLATPVITTIYCVTISNGTGCSDRGCMRVTVDYNCGEIFVPTAFSPNADHQNDVECVLGNCIIEMTFSIYDRWGEKVFETNDPELCWNGIYKGKELNSAVFAYTLKAKLVTGEMIEKKGNISLIR